MRETPGGEEETTTGRQLLTYPTKTPHKQQLAKKAHFQWQEVTKYIYLSIIHYSLIHCKYSIKELIELFGWVGCMLAAGGGNVLVSLT